MAVDIEQYRPQQHGGPGRREELESDVHELRPAPYDIPPQDMPLASLLKKLSDDSTRLVREEVELTKREVRDQLRRTAKSAGGIGAWLAVAYMGALGLMGGLILLLAFVIPLWLSAMVCGALFATVGLSLALHEKNEIPNLNEAPERAFQRGRKDLRQIKEAAR